MAADHFCLRWNNYQSNMVSELDTLRSEEHLVDVTLSCEGQKFRAHKVILSACSAYFRNVFKENPCEHPVVILKDVSCEDVEALLSFVYQGVVYVSEKKLNSFLQTAELLQIKGLTGAASTLKDENLSEKAATMPNKAIVPPRKVLPAVSPPHTPATKRRKGAPVRICKPNEEAEDSDNNSQRDEDDHDMINMVKQERIDDVDNRHALSEGQAEEDISMEGEVEGECEDGAANAYSAAAGGDVSGTDNGEDGEVRRDESTLLERSLVAASMSRSFDSQGAFPPFSVTGSGSRDLVPGNLPLPDQITPTGSHLAQCGNCPHCGQKYSNQSALKYHVRLMHSDLTNRLCCYLCPRSFMQREQFKVHMWEKHKVRW